jgi:hypothetical protein
LFLAGVLVWATALAEPDQTRWFVDIVVPAGQEVQSATCFFCSIQIDGMLRGDATMQWGDIIVNGVTGSATAVAGNVRLGDGANVEQDKVSVFGDTTLAANSQLAATLSPPSDVFNSDRELQSPRRKWRFFSPSSPGYRRD